MSAVIGGWDDSENIEPGLPGAMLYIVQREKEGWQDPSDSESLEQQAADLIAASGPALYERNLDVIGDDPDLLLIGSGAFCALIIVILWEWA